jgi:hypothetical protein
MNFEGDAFISYAHLDNLELVEGRKGWVANFHRALEIRVAQLLGKSPHIWRDPKLSGNDLFAETLLDRLKRVAVLVSIVTPRYLKSEWTLREFTEFLKSAEQQGGLKVRDKARVFKVLKQPVPLDRVPPELRAILGYEFFSTDPETGKVRELDEVFGPEAQRDFWLRLDDLAHDLVALLEALEADAQLAPFVPDAMQQATSSGQPPAATSATQPSVPGGNGSASVLPHADTPPVPANGVPRSPVAPSTATVYLAETTADVREQRESLRRDLQQQGFRVLPDAPIPHDQAEALPAILSSLAQARMSIHLFGRNYGVVPEGATHSIAELQYELATERAGQGRFSRLLWIPPGLQIDDARQKALLDAVRVDPRIGTDADMLETPFEDLRTAVMDWLARDSAPPPSASPAPGSAPQVYFIADQRDVDRIGPWSDALFGEHLEIIHPIFEGDEAEIREFHEETLSACDGCVIFYGSGNELWLRRKLREIQKSPGYGRTKPLPLVCIAQIAPHTQEKDRFRSHEAIVVPQWDGVALDSLRPFITQLKAGHSA